MSPSVLLLAVVLAGQATAFWRLPCNGLLTTERADAVVSPGAVSGHVHAIVGGSGFVRFTSYEGSLGLIDRQGTDDIILWSTSQCTSCYVQQDMSAYWTPNLWFQFVNGSFTPVPQVGGILVYYLQRGPAGAAIKAFPDGFRMLAGNPMLRSYNSASLSQQAISFVCLDYSRNNGVPQTPNLPTQGCSDGLRAQVFFPSCWDGQNLDSSTHNTHVAYPDGMDNGNCPTGYPVRLISIFYEVTFDTWSMESLRSQAKNPNQPFVFSNGDPTGYGFHGDFINGWDNTVLQNAVDTCTDDSGVIEKCGVFKFNDANAQCHKTPDVNETVTGLLPRLPGCNPVQSGPANASPCADPSPPNLIANPVVYQTKMPPYGAPVLSSQPSVVGSGSGYNYLGCYPDNGARTLATSLTTQATTSNGMTPASCLAACKAGGFTYCGLEYARECWAANAFSNPGIQPVADGNCGMVCTGASNAICGDGNLLTTYKLSAGSSPAPAPAPPTTMTTTTTSPVQQTTTSTTAAVTTTTASTPSPVSSKIVASGSGFQYIGCFVDQGPRLLPTSLTSTATTSGSMTPASCLAACQSAHHQYCGLEYGRECWSADVPSSTTSAVADSQCNMACTGDSAHVCGDGNRLTMYQNPNWTPPLSTNPGPAGSSFLGCYTDNVSNRSLNVGKPGGSVATCVQNCKGYAYAGVEYSGECYCSNTINSAASIASPSNNAYLAGCNMACTNNATEACGGPNRINIYRLATSNGKTSVRRVYSGL